MNSKDNNTADVDIAVIRTNLKYILDEVTEIKSMIKNDYVRMDTFLPVQRIVYGLVGIVLVSFVGALLTFVINK